MDRPVEGRKGDLCRLRRGPQRTDLHRAVRPGRVLSYIFDDHPQKVDKLSPGHRIPVLPTAELEQRMPDYVFILAWIHAEKIVAKHRGYLEKGGRFVILCPELQVIDAASTATIL